VIERVNNQSSVTTFTVRTSDGKQSTYKSESLQLLELSQSEEEIDVAPEDQSQEEEQPEVEWTCVVCGKLVPPSAGKCTLCGGRLKIP
jgi:rubrerythrin